MAIAQNGILRRDLAACTYTGWGLGGGGAAGAGDAVRAGGPEAVGAASLVVGVVDGELATGAVSPEASTLASSP